MVYYGLLEGNRASERERGWTGPREKERALEGGIGPFNREERRVGKGPGEASERRGETLKEGEPERWERARQKRGTLLCTEFCDTRTTSLSGCRWRGNARTHARMQRAHARTCSATHTKKSA